MEDNIFHATEQSAFTPPSDSEADPDSRILPLKGFRVDVVKATGTLWIAKVSESFNYDAAFILQREIREFLDTSRYNLQAREEAAWRIPIGEKEFGPLGIVRKATEASATGMKHLANASRPSIFGPPVGIQAVSYMGMMGTMYDSRPFISNSGYVGLCAGEAGPGDIIFIPLGAHVPYMLREVRGHRYKLLGEAYVYGLMEGEINDQGLMAEVIELE
jgi:hypothetical protein